MEPTNNREVGIVIDDLLKSIGFVGGKKDVECCYYDYELLKTWYIYKRSLINQELSRSALQEWLDSLFPSNCKSLSGRQSHSSSWAEETAQILRSLSSNTLCDTHDHILGSSSYGGSSSPSIKGPQAVRHNRNRSGDYLIPNPTPSRSIIDYFSMKYFSFCSVKADPVPSGKADLSVGDISNDDGNHFDSISFGASSSRFDDAQYSDLPPRDVTKFLNLFYCSKLQKLVLMDLLSLGQEDVSNAMDPLSQAEIASESGRSSIGELALSLQTGRYSNDIGDYDNGYESGQEEKLKYLLPIPPDVNALLLPPRSYVSFIRMSRMLERLFESEDSSKLWSLTFRDCDFAGDFHITLLTMLRTCPQVWSLNFENKEKVETDALLGQVVGEIPSSVRFLSFKRTLCKESIQTLCMLIRKQNAAYTAPYHSDLHFVADTTLLKSPYDLSRDCDNKDHHSSPDCKAKVMKSRKMPSKKGLMGLALTHFALETAEIDQIIILLEANVKKATTPSGSTRKMPPSTMSAHSLASVITSPSLSNVYSTPNATPRPHSHVHFMLYYNFTMIK
jgi:hypothetical protein